MPALCDKLLAETDDFSTSFSIQDNEDYESFQATATKTIPSASDVFVLNHQLTFKMEKIRSVLEENPNIVDNLRYQLKYFGKNKKIPGLASSKPIENKFTAEFDE